MPSRYQEPDRFAAWNMLKLAGIVFGLGVLVRAMHAVPMVGGALMLAGLVFAVSAAGIALIGGTAGSGLAHLFTQMYGASGATTPAPKLYSAIEALVARGEYAQAADAYVRETMADSGDVEACLRLAELRLRHLHDPEGAAAAYRDARDRCTDERRAQFIAFRLVDIYRDRLGDPGRAIVELRRFLDSFPNARQAAGARAELERLMAVRTSS